MTLQDSTWFSRTGKLINGDKIQNNYYLGVGCLLAGKSIMEPSGVLKMYYVLI